MRKRRREDLAAARRLSEEFALGEVRIVTRRRAERLYRTGSARTGVGLAAGAVAGAVLLPVWLIGSVLGLPVVVAVVGGMVSLLLMAGGSVGGIILNHSFAPGTAADRVFTFAGGLAHLAAGQPEPRVLRWADVDSVTVTFLDEELWYYGWYFACTVRGGTGTEITLSSSDQDTVGRAKRLGHGLITEAARLLGERLVPQMIEDYESGQPVTIGGWTVDQTGITASESGYVTGSCSWAGITRIAFERKPAKRGPVVVIRVYIGSDQPALTIGLTDVPNGILLVPLIVHAAAGNGIEVHDDASKQQQELLLAGRSPGLMTPPS
jgi:hypothetical protein